MKNAVFVVIVIVAAVLLGLFVGRFLTGGSDKTEVFVNIDRIRAIAELATVEMHSTVIEHVHEKHAWYEWKSAELLVIVSGSIRGGLDLDKIEMKKSGDNKRVTITIPSDAITVTNPIIDPKDGIELITISNPNIFHPITDAQRNQAQKKCLADLKSKVIDAGIKEKTLEEAKKVLTNFLAILEVEVEFIMD